MSRIDLAYDGDKLRVKFKFKKRTLDHLKNIGGGFFDGNDWIFSNNKTREICRLMRQNELPLTLSEEIQGEFGVNKYGFSEKELLKKKTMLNAHPSAAKDDVNFDEKCLRFREGLSLLPFQRAGISYAISKNGRCLFADEMGLGKTIQGIGIIRHYESDLPAVICAPASLLYNWKKEILKWLPDFKEDDIHVAKKSTDKPRGKVFICGYDYTIKNEKVLSTFLGLAGIFIIDESHNIKNPDAKRSKSIINIGHVAKRLIFITGTPILNRPIELYTTLYALDPLVWPDYFKFASRYCDAEKTKFGWDFTGSSYSNELHMTLINDYMVRRKKNDVLTQLPDKKRFTRYIDCGSDERLDLEGKIHRLTEMCREALNRNSGNRKLAKRYLLDKSSEELEGGSIFELYNMTSKVKAQAVADMIADEMESNPDDKIILFAHHSDFMNILQTAVESKLKAGESFIRVDGSMPAEKRFLAAEEFQNNDQCKVAVLSIMAASVGLTLTKSNKVYMCELPWTPGISQQAEDRAHRLTQTKDVFIYYMLAEGTLDASMWSMLNSKSNTSNEFIDGGTSQNLSEDDSEFGDPSSGDIIDLIFSNIKREDAQKSAISC